MTKRIFIAALWSVALVGSASAQNPAANVDEINAIINDLKPAAVDVKKQPVYIQNIRKIEIPVRIDIQNNTTYRPGHQIVQRSYVLNYNHSRDFRIHFRFDSAQLTGQAKVTLNALGQALLSPALANTNYMIGGHTDSAGGRGYNQWLSERRALAVKSYLVNTFGILPSRLQTVGFGEEFLIDPRRGPNKKNRRVEVTLLEAKTFQGKVSSTIQFKKEITDNYDSGNIVCDTAPVPLEDPRPARHNLDDFGSPRTPVACEDVHSPVEGDVKKSPVETPSTDAINDAINSDQ